MQKAPPISRSRLQCTIFDYAVLDLTSPFSAVQMHYTANNRINSIPYLFGRGLTVNTAVRYAKNSAARSPHFLLNAESLNFMNPTQAVISR